MVVVAKVPSPWGEAAKGIFHIKGIDFAAVRLVYDNEALKTWAGQLSGPVAIYNDEPPRSGWAEILMLAERLAPTPALLSLVPEMRATARCCWRTSSAARMDSAGIAACSWCTRDSRRPAGSSSGSPAYLGGKYGYDAAAAAQYSARVIELLGEFAGVLRAQRAAGKSLLPRRRAERGRRLQRDVHGAVQAAAAGTMRHASRRARGRSSGWTRRPRRRWIPSCSSIAT